MASGHKATLLNMLSGFPQKAGNRNWVAYSAKGPDDYDTLGNAIPLPKGINFVEEVICSEGVITATGVLYHIHPIITPQPSATAGNRQTGGTGVTLVFIANTTGVEPADNTDLSNVLFRISFRGRR